MSTPATSYTPARTCCNDSKHVIPESIVVIREGLITTFPGCPECLAKWQGSVTSKPVQTYSDS